MPGFPALEQKDYAAVREALANGDLLLASGAYTFSKLIQKATDSCWSHVAFIMRLDEIGRIMVLESIEQKGVRTIPLSEYVRNFEGTGHGYNGRLAIGRDQRFAGAASPDKLQAMAQFAIDRLAYPYDDEEIARITARIVASGLGFEPGEIKRNDEYICSEYVYECYRRIGLEIDYDPRGFIAPADFARNAHVELICEIPVQ